MPNCPNTGSHRTGYKGTNVTNGFEMVVICYLHWFTAPSFKGYAGKSVTTWSSLCCFVTCSSPCKDRAWLIVQEKHHNLSQMMIMLFPAPIQARHSPSATLVVCHYKLHCLSPQIEDLQIFSASVQCKVWTSFSKHKGEHHWFSRRDNSFVHRKQDAGSADLRRGIDSNRLLQATHTPCMNTTASCTCMCEHRSLSCEWKDSTNCRYSLRTGAADALQMICSRSCRLGVGMLLVAVSMLHVFTSVLEP